MTYILCCTASVLIDQRTCRTKAFQSSSSEKQEPYLRACWSAINLICIWRCFWIVRTTAFYYSTRPSTIMQKMWAFSCQTCPPCHLPAIIILDSKTLDECKLCENLKKDPAYSWIIPGQHLEPNFKQEISLRKKSYKFLKGKRKFHEARYTGYCAIWFLSKNWELHYIPQGISLIGIRKE